MMVGGEQLERRQLLAVTAATPLADLAIEPAAAPLPIPLAAAFQDSAVTGTVVRFATNAPLAEPDIFVELFDADGPGRSRTTPLTVANFLGYARGDSYRETIMHRSVPGYLIQGGGFQAPTRAADQIDSDPAPVTTGPPVLNEPGNTNRRGTIALAKSAGDPDSGTSQWFFNLADNAATLDDLNGGVTVFGQVLGTGMTVVDAMAAATPYDASPYYGSGVFTDLPLWNLNADSVVQPSDFLRIENVAELTSAERFIFSATSSSDIVSAEIVAGELRLQPTGAGGRAVITVRATSPFDPGDYAEQSFVFDVAGRPAVDLNGDGRFDGLWRDAASGSVVGLVYDAELTAIEPRPLGGDTDWSIGAAGDFNADGTTDFVWLQASTGLGVMRLLDPDGSDRAAAVIGGSTEWGIDAAGDFDADGKTDIVWRHHATGLNVMWLMDGAASKSQTMIGGDRDWRLVPTDAAFDANDDGNGDLIWRHAPTGTQVLKRMKGATELSATVLGGDTDWRIVATGDFDGDGQSDALWRQASSGAVVQWLLLDGALKQATWVGGSSDWSVVSSDDFDGDGKADIFWRQASTGVTVVRKMDGAPSQAGRILGGDLTWRLLGRPAQPAEPA